MDWLSAINTMSDCIDSVAWIDWPDWLNGLNALTSLIEWSQWTNWMYRLTPLIEWNQPDEAYDVGSSGLKPQFMPWTTSWKSAAVASSTFFESFNSCLLENVFSVLAVDVGKWYKIKWPSRWILTWFVSTICFSLSAPPHLVSATAWMTPGCQGSDNQQTFLKVGLLALT